MRWSILVSMAVPVLVAAAPGAAPAAAIPAPKFDRIDYAHEGKYLDLPPTLGKRATIEKVAAEIEGKTPRAKLGAIGGWITAHLRYDEKAAYAWRDFDGILADASYGGCADHAEVFGAIARACGIPAVWVKTMDADWIRAFRRTRDENRTWSGHVFLEVHLEGKWLLLDATQGVLYEDYDPRQRILPGNRFAYDKGGDAYELLLSVRWEEWKEQTRRYFGAFDLSQLDAPQRPLGKGTRLPVPGAVVVLGNNPEWQAAVDRVRALKRPCAGGGDGGFDDFIPLARDGWLVVLCLGGRTVLPDRYRGLLPEGWEDAAKNRPSGVLSRKSPDGTTVLLVFGRDAAALRAEIAKLVFEE